jgi:hypothetical protein
MANRANRIAAPIINRIYDGTEASARKAAEQVRVVLATHQHTDGSRVHPCVIAEWANEPYKRMVRPTLGNRSRSPSVLRLERRQRRINRAKNKAQRIARKINRLVEKMGTIAQRIFRRHIRRAHDRSQ